MRTAHRRTRTLIIAVLAAACTSAAVAAAAQDPQPPPAGTARVRPELRQGQGRSAQQADRLEIAELQRLFDAYMVMQAQEALQLDDVQFGQFLPKLKALQETRRRNEQARTQLVGELGRLTAPSAATLDEAALRDRLRALQELESRSAAELRRAYDTIDQQLDVRRQARFRVFEQNMERRKLQLMLRARRGAAGQVL
ncbi:MAG: hypothetical protein MUE61_05475 [Vicinamibacterales bacterium]|jgi:hypothetical protein|nr:hypothetical protein [Vicinamibacterales bacterium]